jgi:hypothetical protein
MDVVSLCAMKASGFVWQPRVSAYALTLICKATFELRPNECVLAPEQEEPSDADTYWNDDSRRSVVAPSDRAPYKPRADVVLVGHAYAPKREPARSIMTRLVVGEIDKAIEVWCDRGVRTRAGQLLEGQRQTKMLLTWERAAGGPETSNPVGMRFDAPPDHYGMVAIPNLQPPGVHLGKPGDTFVPIGYGPIAPHWPGRTLKLYRHAARFAASGWEEQPIPENFDYGYFNVAPPDQQVAELRPNERIVLENLHPQHERLVTSLPGIRPRAVADRATGEREEVALAADTLWIDTDRGIFTLVWRGRIGLRHAKEAGRVAFWVDGLAISSGTRAAPQQAPANSIDREKQEPRLEVGTITIVPGHNADMATTLPFIKAEPSPPSLVGTSSAAPPPWLGPLANAVKVDDGTGTLAGGMITQGKDPLPFAHGAGASRNLMGEPAAWPMTARSHDDDGTGTIEPGLQPAPKGAGPPPLSQPSATPVPPPPMVFIQSTIPVGFAMEEEPATTRGKKLPADELVKEVALHGVTPPPMIGPLAAAETAAEAKAKPERAKSEKMTSAISAPENLAAPTEAKQKLADFPLERCSALSASIARRKGEKAAILARNDLTSEQWAELELHWADVIQEETKRGKTDLLSRYDAAYVAQLETERGIITVEEYAQLAVAAERGVERETLAKMDLPRGVMLRLRRVWLKKTAADAALAKRVREALEDE